MRNPVIHIAALFFAIFLGVIGCVNFTGGESTAMENSVRFLPIRDEAAIYPDDEQIVARVNGQPISQAIFERRLKQFQSAIVDNHTVEGLSEDQLAEMQKQVLQGLIDQLLIEQAAQSQDIIITKAKLKQKLAELQAGQTEAEFQAWLALNDFTRPEFQEMLRSQLIVADLAAAIMAEVSTIAEQVHARHILLPDEAQALAILTRLQAGESFVALAQQFSVDEANRAIGGDLGWFPRGIHVVPPQVEALAFSLEVDEISPVIESVLGYHLVKVEMRHENRPLRPQHWQQMQHKAFTDWLAHQRASAQIEHFLN